MKKNKGFTLIELLAVIVILAVIALIATPIIIGIIEDSRVKANENSAYGIIDSAKYYYTQGLLKPENSIEYNTDILGKLTYNGGKPKAGSSAYINADGEVAVALLYGNKCYVKEYSEEKLKEGDAKDCKVTIPTSDLSLSDVIMKGPIVTTGSGLYKMSDTEYRYRGGCNLQGSEGNYTCADVDPINNYVSIGGQKYRIISVDSQGVKMMSEKKLARNMPFDSRTSTTEGPRNNANNTFCQVTSGNYYGCNVYVAMSGTLINESKTGTVTQNSTLYDYLNTTGTDVEIINLGNKALSVTWNIGGVTWGGNRTLAIVKMEERKYVATFKIGLINISDYIIGSLDTNCETDPLSYTTNSKACKNNNWLFDGKSESPWTLNPIIDNTTNIYRINGYDGVLVSGDLENNSVFQPSGVRPVGYLSSDILVKGGEGTSAKPWIIE